MNEEFYRRQAEANQEHDHQNSQQSHATLETYNLEQQEAHQGHIPAQPGAEPQPSLWQRIRKMLGL